MDRADTPPFESTAPVLEVLARAREIGILGKSIDLASAIEHSFAFSGLLSAAIQAKEQTPGHSMNKALSCVDMGSGSGLPGLILAYFTEYQWVLCDRSQKKADFLRWAAQYLKLEISIIQEGAEELTDKYDYATSRAFASPPLVAECAANILNQGGAAIISDNFKATPSNQQSILETTKQNMSQNISEEQYAQNERWNIKILERLGFTVNFVKEPFAFVVLTKTTKSEYERRSWKKMLKQPLW